MLERIPDKINTNHWNKKSDKNNKNKSEINKKKYKLNYS